MEKREFKNKVYIEISKIAKSISNANRLEIIDLLSNGPKSVEKIALETGINFANASQHLQNLKKERIIISEKKGNYVLYALANSEVYKAYKGILNLALSVSPHIEIEKNNFRKNYSSEPTISYQEIKEREDICLIDVRPKDEFLISHFPNAISIPIESLEISLKQLPKSQLIVAYCRGMFCTYADEAVKILKENGYSALRMDENINEINKLNR